VMDGTGFTDSPSAILHPVYGNPAILLTLEPG
jgi:hypothetical protein